MWRRVKHDFIKSPYWFVYLYKKKKEIKRNAVIDVFILILCCQSINNDARVCVIMMTSYIVLSSELYKP